MISITAAGQRGGRLLLEHDDEAGLVLLENAGTLEHARPAGDAMIGVNDNFHSEFLMVTCSSVAAVSAVGTSKLISRR